MGPLGRIFMSGDTTLKTSAPVRGAERAGFRGSCPPGRSRRRANDTVDTTPGVATRRPSVPGARILRHMALFCGFRACEDRGQDFILSPKPRRGYRMVLWLTRPQGTWARPSGIARGRVPPMGTRPEDADRSAIRLAHPTAHGFILRIMGIPFTQVRETGSLEGWKMRCGRCRGLITRGRFKRWTTGSTARRDAGTMSGGCAGRTGLFVGDAGRSGSPG